MAESGSSHSTTESASGVDFPFADPPPVRRSAETVLNPEGRAQSAEPDETVVALRPDANIQSVLFPDLSQLMPGEQPPSPSGIKLAHFEIVDRIGTGGMGSVFLSLDTHLQRYVALKILSPSQAREPSSVQRFLNEARAAARLDYDGIARVHFYGEDRGFHFIAFEYITGTNVRDLIQQQGPLSPGDAINFTLQVAHALKQTSAAGVVHRDIKPSNIIVNSAGRAKLVDLGLARKESSESMEDLTVAGTTLGTFDYISPEQAKDPRNVDVRSDIYSLGCTLFHMLTGEPPYPDGTLAQKILEHQHDFVPNPSDLNRRIPAQLSAVTQKMMASDPKKRYQSPESLIRDLLAVATDHGLRGVTPEGLIWSDHLKANQQPFLVKYAGWLAAVCVLLLIVFAIDRFDRTQPNLQGLASSTTPAESSELDNASDSTSNAETTLEKTDTPESNMLVTNNVQGETISGSLTGNSRETGSGEAELLELMKPGQIFNATGPEEEPIPSPLVANNDQPATEGDLDVEIPRRPTASSIEPKMTAPPLPEDPETPTEEASEEPSSPVTLLAMGATEPQYYKTLEAACANARSGGIIELKYNGFLQNADEKPITINKSLTIRAAKNYRPVIAFSTRATPDESDTRMITVREGALNLVNVDLYLKVRHGVTYPNRDTWTMFSLQGPDQLSLKNVSVTIDNPDRTPAAVVEIARGIGSDLDKMKMKTSGTPVVINPFSISIEDSMIRGECQAISVKSSRQGMISLENCLVAVEGSFLVNLGSTDMPEESNELQIELQHSSIVTGTTPVRIDSGEVQRFLLPISLTTENCLYALNPSFVAPFVSMSGATNPVDLRQSLSWYGKRNYYHGFQIFWTIADSLGSSDFSDLEFEDWVSYWTDRKESFEETAVTGELTWSENWSVGNAVFSNLTPLQLQLDSDSENQQDLLASDGTILGATIETLREPPKLSSSPLLPLD